MASLGLWRQDELEGHDGIGRKVEKLAWPSVGQGQDQMPSSGGEIELETNWVLSLPGARMKG